MQIERSKRTTNLILFLGIIILFSSVSMIAANTVFLFTDNIYQGVSVAGIAVGGLSLDSAQHKIMSIFQERMVRPSIMVSYQDHNWPVMAKDIDLYVDATTLAREAYDAGRTGNIVYQLQERYLAVNKGYNVPLKLSYSHTKLSALFHDIANSIELEPHNAIVKQQGSNVEVIPEIMGRKVDVTKSIAEAVTRLETDFSFSLQLVVDDVYPKVMANDLKDIDGVIASYTTQFDSSDQNRTQNITLAATAINGVLVRSQDSFSFNKQVGSRLSQNGYKEAPGYINGELVPDWGGGVCQVSTTLYNAVLLADATIEERTSHLHPPGYVPIGQDATVADNLLDFKFKNPLPYNIYITNVVSSNYITFYILGQKSANPSGIRIVSTNKKVLEPNIIVKQDPGLELGKEIVEVAGQQGFQVTTWRVKEVNGQDVSEILASDEFKPVDRVVRVGTKVPPTQATK